MKKQIINLMFVLGLSGSMVACGSAPQEEVVEEVIQVIGAEDESAKTVEVVNKTGQDITSLSMKDNGADPFSSNLIKDGEVFENDGNAKLFYNAGEDKEYYYMSVTLDDGTEVFLNYFTFEDVKDTTEIHYEDGIGFITYVSAESDDEVSLKQTEIDYLDQLAAKKKAEEEAKAAEEAQQEEPIYYEEPTYIEQPVYIPEAPAQGTEGCLGGGVVIN